MDATAQDTKKAVLRINIDKWSSPVALQHGIHSIPFLKVYDASGKLVAEGKEAYRYLK